MTAALTSSELLQLRMRAQLLSHSQEGSSATSASAASDASGAADPDPGQLSGPQRVAAVTRHMLALQGQDWPASRWALGVRAPGTAVADVYAAFNEGLIVRSWPMRGTVHVVAAEDIGWIQGLTSARVLRGAAKRREFLGIDDATLDRIVEVSLSALAGGARLTREELSASWTAAGIAWQGNWRYHLVWWLCQNGLTTLGPVQRRDGAPADTAADALDSRRAALPLPALPAAVLPSAEPLIVLADDWISAPRQLSGDEALCELAGRYAAARGPVTAKDLAWWAGLTMSDSKRGLALATETGVLQQVFVADNLAPHWMAPELLGTEQLGSALAPGAAIGSEPGLLLPAFDEHLLGYTDRRPQLDPAHFDRIVPGKNGMFRATVVAGGVAAGHAAGARAGSVQGTWQLDKSALRGKGRKSDTGESRIIATPMPGGMIRPEEFTEPLAQWARFHGRHGAALEVTESDGA